MYYKVVYYSEPENRYFSSVMHHRPCEIGYNKIYTKAEVEYFFNKFTQAPEWLFEQGYHLCVFDNKDAAINFAYDDDVQIWECECEDMIERLPESCTPFAVVCGKLSGYNYWPKGTVMAKRIKLTKLIFIYPNQYIEE